MTQLKIIFAGTPEFAAASLGALLGRPELSVIAVYTQPDKPAGRGQQLRESAVKQLAVTQGLAVYQPASLRDETAIANLRALGADLLVVAAYGQILPRAVLEAPRLGAINGPASIRRVCVCLRAKGHHINELLITQPSKAEEPRTK